MDLLQECAQAFEKLLGIKYEITIGRRGKTIDLVLGFDKSEFHHLAGLHKLVDIEEIRSAKRTTIYEKILKGEISYEHIKASVFYEKCAKRLKPLRYLETIFDSNEIIFRYDINKTAAFSVIRADFLLENLLDEDIIYVFLGLKELENEYHCVTVFPKERLDYTIGQTKYTLLRKVKRFADGTFIEQYNRLR